MNGVFTRRLGALVRSGLCGLGLAGLLASPAVAQTGGSAASPPVTKLATIKIPNVPPAKGTWSFDISWVDASGRYYLADRTNKGVDVIDPKTNSLVRVIGGFVGAHVVNGKVDNDASGPNGILVIDNRQEAWVGDGNSTLKVVDLTANQVVASIPTGGKKRADELAYDPADDIVVIANDADDPPFLTFVSVVNRSVLGQIPYPDATNGLEQPVWNPANGMFYQAVPQTKANPGGQIDVIDPKAMKVTQSYVVSGCVPHGLALGPNQQMAVGCSGDGINLFGSAETLIMDAASGKIVATIPQVGGTDEAWYSPSDGRYYLAASSMTAGGVKGGKPTPVLGVIDAYNNTWLGNVPTDPSSHSVAADPATGKILAPLTLSGLGVFRSSGLVRGQTYQGTLVGTANGTTRNYPLFGDGNLVTLNLSAGPLDAITSQAVGMVIYDPTGNVVLNSTLGSRSNGTITEVLSTAKDATYTVQVFNYQPGSSVQYTLTLS